MKAQIMYLQNYIQLLKPKTPVEPMSEAVQKHYDLLMKGNEVQKDCIGKYAKGQ
jgi:hypothetical protein